MDVMSTEEMELIIYAHAHLHIGDSNPLSPKVKYKK